MSNPLFFEFLNATWETIYMVLISGGISVLFGIPLGVLLYITHDDGILKHKYFYGFFSIIVNAIRSIPFIILLIAVVPLTRLLTGTSIGTTAAIVPLSIAAIPFVARMVSNALSEINPGLIEAGNAMGASPFQIISKILLPESMPGIINCITVTIVNLIGYSAMAGAVGGGGLGDLAIRYGYQRFDVMVMLATILVLILLVQIFQYIGDKTVVSISHR